MKKNEKEIKYCNVRMSADLHKKAKFEAMRVDISLQEWISKVVFEALQGIVYSKNAQDSK